MSAPEAVEPPTLELLAWMAAGPRSYGETMEAWRTSCPRLSVWEDAIAAGLVEIRRDGLGSEAVVALTPLGEAAVGAASGAVQAR